MRGIITEEIKKKILEKEIEEASKKSYKPYKDFKAAKKPEITRTFDKRDRLGLRSFEDVRWRKRRIRGQT
ncbi:hypothetical protein LCGC14_0829490 [marine sediment metagenome]|uniref:Uncharacterized protein n=1 Tax=marine sediment metagenome TaxID=412755 RepID=A0A0F9PL55_9ZZZZ